MAPAFHSGGGAARDDDGQARVVMHVGIADAAAVKIEAMVEKSSVSFACGFQLFQKVSKQRDVELIDLRHARNFFRIIAVMRKRMMRIGHTDLRISAIAGFTRELEGDDACDIALESQDLQIEHQSNVVGV